MNYFNAFWVGGLICALVQILLDKTKLMPGRVMVLLVCAGAFLSAVGFYKPLVDFAGAGASVPLIGFGHVLWEGMKKAIEEDGSSAFLPEVLPPAQPVYPRLSSFPIWPASSSVLR